MESPGDGWEHELVRACSLYTGSFFKVVQGFNIALDRWQSMEEGRNDRRESQGREGSDRSCESDLRQNARNARGAEQLHVGEPLRLGTGGGPLGMAATGSPFFLYCAARKLATQRTTWLGAAGLATAASLSAAMAATSAEIPPVDAVQREADQHETDGVQNGGNEVSQTAAADLALRAWGRYSKPTWQHIFGKCASSGGGCLDPILGEEEGELSSACISVTKGVSKGAVVEPKTKARFPVLLCDDGEDGPSTSSESCQVLAGVGIRSKSLIKLKSIKVYAFGLYVRPEKLREEFGAKYAGVPPEELKLREDFYKDLLSHEVGMTVRLVVHYKGLSMEMVRSAFVQSLRNRLRKIKGTEEDEGLAVFSSYFSQPFDISRGTTIDFRWLPGGRLLTEIAGKKMEPIVSPHLCRAFFDLYIGEPPVSEAAKQEIGESFARMLSAC